MDEGPSRRKRPPDWIIYAAAVAGLVALAVAGQERADAPPAPPPIAEDDALVAASSIDVSELKPMPHEAVAGTAFSISDKGIWLTARHVVAHCRQAGVMVAPQRGVRARVVADPSSDLAVLETAGGAPPLPLAPVAVLGEGRRGFHPGYPQGRPGEAASRLLGPEDLKGPARGARTQKVLAWAEVGRTDGLDGSLAGLSGAPVLDGAGRVLGVTLAESPRRGRIYSSTPQAIGAALAMAHAAPSGFARGEVITTDNYGRVADDLRRDLRVAQVVCLD
ncbi:MAG: serine protease [Caulobacteraceae bacterium]